MRLLDRLPRPRVRARVGFGEHRERERAADAPPQLARRRLELTAEPLGLDARRGRRAQAGDCRPPSPGGRCRDRGLTRPPAPRRSSERAATLGDSARTSSRGGSRDGQRERGVRVEALELGGVARAADSRVERRTVIGSRASRCKPVPDAPLLGRRPGQIGDSAGLAATAALQRSTPPAASRRETAAVR